MKKRLLSILTVLGMSAMSAIGQSSPVQLRPISTTKLTGGFDEGAAEISSYDAGSKRLFVVNGSTDQIDVLDIANPVAPEYLFSIDISIYGGGANSVVAFDGYVAVAIEAFTKQDNGTLAIFDVDGNNINIFEVGALPDMVGISHDHNKLVVCNEGEPNTDYSVDPVGSISIIDISMGAEMATQNDVTAITFENFNHIRNSFEMEGDNWPFIPEPANYDNAGVYTWGPVNTLAGRNPIHGDQFWGIQMLENEFYSAQEHTLTFDFAELTERPLGTLAIRYFTEGFEADDYLGVKVMTQVDQSWEELPVIALDELSEGWAEYRISLEDNPGFVAIQIVAYCNDADDFAGIEWVRIDFLDEQVRIFGNDFLSEVDQDLEPEYAAFSYDGTQAVITLQENNAVAIVDLTTNSLVGISPLGYKNYNTPGNGIDASNSDGMINIQNWPALGMYQPDGITSFEVNGETYYITANEGDAREYDSYVEIARISSQTLDPTVFPDAATLKSNANLGRLNITTSRGDIDFDGDLDELYSYGARSFSIWNSAGEMIYDSGDQMEQITAMIDPDHFNSNNDDNTSFDSRSDDKGPEPEGVTTGVIAGRTYAFIGLERIGGVMVFDVSNPNAPEFIQYINNRGWDENEETYESLDMGPEGITFISKEESPNERDLVIVSNEISGTVTIYQVDINLVAMGDVGLETFDLTNTDWIGNDAGINIFEGGVSGMYHIPGTENEYYVVGDRGPNADANNHPLAQGETKVFIFPDYAPKMHRMVAENGTLTFAETWEIKQPNGQPLSGRPLPVGAGNSGEFGIDANDNPIDTDVWGLDSEGILLGNDGYFWVCDEYGAAVLKLDSEGKVVNRYTPFPTQTEDVQIDPMIGMRRPNRGFEGIAWTPNGKIYAILQSPANNPDAATGNNSRLHRLMELDPLTGEWRTFLYAHKPQIGQIRERDWKLGDLVAINNNEFLLIEHAERNGWNYKNIIKINIENATALTTEDINGLTPEQLLTAEECIANGITPIEGELYFDLLDAGWDVNLDKPEGLTILDATHIAVINDNDFGISSPDADGQIVETGRPTRLFVYSLPESLALNYQSPYCTAENIESVQCLDEVNSVMLPEGYATYEWSNGADGMELSFEESTALVARLTDENNCAAYINVDVTIHPIPEIAPVEGVVLCPNDYSVLAVEGDVMMITWSNGDEGNFSVIDATEYSFGMNEIGISFFNEFGCEGTATTTVEVIENPAVALPSFVEVCEGTTAMLTTGNETDTHIWSTGEETSSIEVSEEGEYSVELVNEFGCTSSAAVYVNIAATPELSLGPDQTICEGTTLVLSVGDFQEILWNDGSSEQSLEVTEGGTYSVMVSDAKGCEASDEVVIATQLCVGVEDVAVESGMEIYPNPVQNELTIQNVLGKDFVWEIYDLSGAVVMQSGGSKNITQKVDVSALSSGFYVIKVRQGNNLIIKQIAKI